MLVEFQNKESKVEMSPIQTWLIFEIWVKETTLTQFGQILSTRIMIRFVQS